MKTGQTDDRDHVGRALRTIEQCVLHRQSLRLTCRRCRSVRVLNAVPVWRLFRQRDLPDAVPERPGGSPVLADLLTLEADRRQGLDDVRRGCAKVEPVRSARSLRMNMWRSW